MNDMIFFNKQETDWLVRTVCKSEMMGSDLRGNILITYEPFDKSLSKNCYTQCMKYHTMLINEFKENFRTFNLGDIIKCNKKGLKNFTEGQYYKIESTLLADDGPESTHVFVTSDSGRIKLKLKDLLLNFNEF